jgi:hypothetical protein
MDLFLTFFVVSQFLRKWTNSSSFCGCSPLRQLSSLARSAPPRAVVVAPALIPGPSASALTCHQRPLACRSRRAGSRPLPVSVRPRLPPSSSSSSSPPSTAVDAPDRPSPSRRRASFCCFVCVVISRNIAIICSQCFVAMGDSVGNPAATKTGDTVTCHCATTSRREALPGAWEVGVILLLGLRRTIKVSTGGTLGPRLKSDGDTVGGSVVGTTTGYQG